MKLRTLYVALLTSCTFSVNAVTYHQPDQKFLEVIEQAGITQKNWEEGGQNKLLLKNAYRLTHSAEMTTGTYIHNFGKAEGFDIDNITSWDLDGEYPLSVVLRDRLNVESLVILKDGRLVDEYYWNGLNKDSTHLQRSITKSFTMLTLSTLVADGLVDMNAPITKYVPELKTSSAFATATVQDVADMRTSVDAGGWEGSMKMGQVQEWNGPYDFLKHKSVVDFAAQLHVKESADAGNIYDYHDVNTEMLGMVITHVTGKPVAEIMEQKLWKKVGFNNSGFMMSNSKQESVASAGLNATGRDVALMMDVLVNGGKNRNGDQVIAPEFIQSLLDGNDLVRSAWSKGKEARMLQDAWYKDQIRTLHYKGRQILAFVGINGQITIGEPKTGFVVHMNGSQEQYQAPRTVMMTFLGVIPALLEALNK